MVEAIETKVKKGTIRLILGIVFILFVLRVILGFGLVSQGGYSAFLAGFLDILLGGTLLVEGFRRDLFSAKNFKRFNFYQAINLLSVFMGGMLVLGGIVQFPLAIFEGIPTGLMSFLSTTGAIPATIAAILIAIQFFMI